MADNVFRITPAPSGPSGPPPSVIFLRPIAAPSVVGLAGYAGSTFIVAAWVAGWYGDDQTPFYFWPFVLLFGGLGQFLAGMWAFVARDNLASVLHTMWGAFWISLGIVYALQGTGKLAPIGRYEHNPALAIWFIVVMVITYMSAVAALVRDYVLATTLFILATGSLLAAIGWFIPSTTVIIVAAYFFIVSVVTALVRLGVYFLVEALPDRFIPGQHDLLPRYPSKGMASMFSRGFKDGIREPGVLKGN